MPKSCSNVKSLGSEWSTDKLLYYTISWIKDMRIKWNQLSKLDKEGTKTLGTHFVFPFTSELEKLYQSPLTVQNVESTLKSCGKGCGQYSSFIKAWEHIRQG